MPAIIIILVLACMAVIGVVAYRADQERRRRLLAWADDRGFRFIDQRQTGWEREYPSIGLFDRGRHRHAPRHLVGELDERIVRCLDYRYTTGSGKNRRTHRYSVVAVTFGQPLIPLHIRREHVFDRVGEFFGHDDLDFESAEFSHRFHVSAADRKWAYDVIHPEMMDYLLQAPPVSIECGVNCLIVSRTGSLSPERCDDGLEVARRFIQLIPDAVLAELRGERS